MLALFSDPATWASLLSLTILEIVLGIDNIVFIAVAASRLPVHQQRKARNFGLGLALGLRILLLTSIAWIAGLTEPAFSIFGFAPSWRDIVLFCGGAFLLVKATQEIHNEVTFGHAQSKSGGNAGSLLQVVGSIALIDVVFSVDSVVAAIGLAEHIEVMILAVTIAIAVMALLAAPISSFVHRHPTTRMLALAFLLVIGAALVADGVGIHFDRKPIYAAIGFAVLVESLNLLRERRRKRKARRRS